MHDIERPAELRKLVADLVEAVRATRDDGRDTVSVERLDCLLCEHLVQVLVPHAAGGIAVTAFFLAEYREAHIGCLEDAGEGDCDFLGTIVEGTHASHPEQDVRAFPTLAKLGHGGDIETFGPLRAVRRLEGPWRSVSFHGLE